MTGECGYACVNTPAAGRKVPLRRAQEATVGQNAPGQIARFSVLCCVKVVVMRLALKLVVVFTVGNIAIAVLYGYLAIRREVHLFHREATAEAETLGHAMEDVLADAWRSTGHEGVLQFVSKANDGQEHHVRIRWVWFDAQPGEPYSPSAAPERLTAVTIEQHQAIEGTDSEGTSYLHIYWPVALSAPAARRSRIFKAHDRTRAEPRRT